MRIIAIFKRIMLQRRGDPRTLAMMFFAPIFILTLMYFLFQVPSNTAYRVYLIFFFNFLRRTFGNKLAISKHQYNITPLCFVHDMSCNQYRFPLVRLIS